MSESELVTMRQLQQELGIKSRATIHKYMREGMPHIKKLGRNYFDRLQVKKWLERYRMGDLEYIDLYAKAQKEYPGQYIEQIEYIKKNGTAKHYMFAMVEIGQYVFSSYLSARETDIILKGAMFDYFLRGLLQALRHVTGEEGFIAIGTRIESLLLETIKQGKWKKYKKFKYDGFFNSEELTMDELEARKIWPDNRERNEIFWEEYVHDR